MALTPVEDNTEKNTPGHRNEKERSTGMPDHPPRGELAVATVPARGLLAINTIKGTGWLYASRYGGKIINLAATVLLARLLTQEDFGVAGYALVFIGFLEVLEGFGVGQALVFMREDDDSRNMAFWIALIFGCLLGLLTYLAAPLAGIIFVDPRAVPVTQALAILFPITALRTVHRSILQRRLQFSRLAIPDFTKAGIKALAAMGFALFDFGAWSLIYAQILGSLVETIAYWRISDWRPSRQATFRRSALKTLTTYGGGIASLNILGVLLSNIDNILVGRYLGAVALGTYMMGFRVPNLLIRQFVTTFSQVIFPVFVHMREQKSAMGDGWLKALRCILIVTAPLSLGLAAVAEPFILTLFGERWAEAIPVVVAISLYTLALSTSFNVGDVYKATGRISLLVRLNLLQAVVTIPAMWWVTVYYADIAMVAWTHVVVLALMSVLQLSIAAKVLALPLSSIARAIAAPLLAALVMFAAILWCNSLTTSLAQPWRLMLGILCGVAVYAFMAWLLLRHDIQQARDLIAEHKRNRSNSTSTTDISEQSEST